MRKSFLKKIMAPGLTLFLCASVSAQDNITPVSLAPSAKYSVATNEFSQNWEVFAGINFSSWFSNEEKYLVADKGFFKGFRTSFGLTLGATKWFSPDIALRAKLTGIKGKRVISEDVSKNEIDYWNLQVQPMLNLSSIIWGYDQYRPWEIKPFLGIGILRNCTDNQYTVPASLGINLSRRITERIKIYAEVEYNLAINEFGREGGWSDNMLNRHDHWTTFSLGLSFELGKNKWDRVPDMDAIEVVPWVETKRQLSEANSEIDRLSGEVTELKNRPEKVVTKTVKDRPDVSVFFELGSYSLTKRGQLENVRKLVETAKAENRIVQVTGYADSQTGSPQQNEMLSARRADTIVHELLLMGLRTDQIRIVTGGGVDTLNPKPANRRVVVSLLK